MRDSYPGQDKKPGIHRDLVEVGETLLLVPSEMPIPCPDVSGSRAEPYARDRSAFRESDIFEVLADGLDIAQVVIPADEAFIQVLMGRAPHHNDRHRFHPRDTAGNRGCIDGIFERYPPSPEMGGGRLLQGRKSDESFPVKREQETSAEHVPEGAVRLHPVPSPAELLREKPSARTGVAGDAIADLVELPVRIGFSPIPYLSCHER